MLRDVIIIRPPCEAYSLLIGVTEGCTWNRCKFCGVYKNIQDYRVRPWASIKKDIDAGFDFYGPGVKHVFLAGGNALSAPTPLLLDVLSYLHERFPGITRVSSYAKNHDILKKSDEELAALATHNPKLHIVYMGLESGSFRILKYMCKGTTSRGMIRAARKIKKSGMQLSVYVVSGLGGKIFDDHAPETARVLTEMDPDYIRFRSLNFIPGSPLHEEWAAGRFKELRPIEIVEEQHAIIKALGKNVGSMVLNDHVSNFACIEGKLPGDREKILAVLEKAMDDPRLQSLPHINRPSM